MKIQKETERERETERQRDREKERKKIKKIKKEDKDQFAPSLTTKNHYNESWKKVLGGCAVFQS